MAPAVAPGPAAAVEINGVVAPAPVPVPVPDVKLAERVGRAMAERGEGDTGTADRGDEDPPPGWLLGPNEVCRNFGTSFPNSLEERRDDFVDDEVMTAATAGDVGGDEGEASRMGSSFEDVIDDDDDGVTLLRRRGLDVGGEEEEKARSWADFGGGGGGGEDVSMGWGAGLN